MINPREALLSRRLSTLEALDYAAAELEADAPDDAMLATIVERGYLRPVENEAVGYWYARYLSVRGALRELIDEILSETTRRLPDADSHHEWSVFLVAYAAACQLVRLDRLMLFRIAASSTMQRKLNEPIEEFRIPRKCYTRIFSAFVDHREALIIQDAIRHLRRHRRRVAILEQDPAVGALARDLTRREAWLDPSRRNYLRRLLDYLGHAVRRRGVVALSNTLAGLMEGAGRTAAELAARRPKRIDADSRDAFAALLRPGDIIVTRHDDALTNLFLPGFWPHVALHIGTAAERDASGIELETERRARWTDAHRVLEARKDGVRFRALADTLGVDHAIVLRPAIDEKQIHKAIARACRHEGKPYNFDFDFFNTDRLVCTEVVYRAYDGLDGISFPMTLRSGRQTLSAEDLIDYALGSRRFDVAALFRGPLPEVANDAVADSAHRVAGSLDPRPRLVTGASAERRLRAGR